MALTELIQRLDQEIRTKGAAPATPAAASALVG